MEATGTIRNELNEVKVSLKRWEMNFIKQSGHKATKADISLNKEVENMYLKYSRYVRYPVGRINMQLSAVCYRC